MKRDGRYRLANWVKSEWFEEHLLETIRNSRLGSTVPVVNADGDPLSATIVACELGSIRVFSVTVSGHDFDAWIGFDFEESLTHVTEEGRELRGGRYGYCMGIAKVCASYRTPEESGGRVIPLAQVEVAASELNWNVYGSDKPPEPSDDDGPNDADGD